MRINPKSFKLVIVFTVTAALCIASVLTFRFISDTLKQQRPRITVTKNTDGKKVIDVTVTLPQIKRDIAPIVVEEFLSQTKISGIDAGGLQLIDFKDNSVLAKYGFERGDIVKEINGHKVNSTKEAINICEDLEGKIFRDREGKDIRVTLDRDGEVIDMNFNIPGFVPEKVYYNMRLQKRSEGKR